MAMSELSPHHKTLTDGVGKCSKPMWRNGLDAGFCDEPAYGAQQRGSQEWIMMYVPALACPGHGGPKRPKVDEVPKADNIDAVSEQRDRWARG
jgi:hypothetical protein